MSRVNENSRRADQLARRLDRLDEFQTDHKPHTPAPKNRTRTRAYHLLRTKWALWLVAALLTVFGVGTLVLPFLSETPPGTTATEAPVQSTSTNTIPSDPTATAHGQDSIEIYRVWFGAPTPSGGELFVQFSADTASPPSAEALSFKLVNVKTRESARLGFPKCDSFNDDSEVITECAVSFFHTKFDYLHRLTIKLRTEGRSIVSADSYPLVVPKLSEAESIKQATQDTSRMPAAPKILKDKLKIDRVRVVHSEAGRGTLRFVVRSKWPETFDLNVRSIGLKNTRTTKWVFVKNTKCVKSTELGEPITDCTFDYAITRSDDHVIRLKVDHREGTQTFHLSDPVALKSASE